MRAFMAFAFACITVASGCTSYDSDSGYEPAGPEKYEDAADQYAAQGSHEWAVRDYQSAIRLGAKPQVYQKLVKSQIELGDFSGALNTYQLLLEKYPHVTDFYDSAIEAAMRSNDPGAIARLKRKRDVAKAIHGWYQPRVDRLFEQDDILGVRNTAYTAAQAASDAGHHELARDYRRTAESISESNVYYGSKGKQGVDPSKSSDLAGLNSIIAAVLGGSGDGINSQSPIQQKQEYDRRLAAERRRLQGIRDEEERQRRERELREQEASDARIAALNERRSLANQQREQADSARPTNPSLSAPSNRNPERHTRSPNQPRHSNEVCRATHRELYWDYSQSNSRTYRYYGAEITNTCSRSRISCSVTYSVDTFDPNYQSSGGNYGAAGRRKQASETLIIGPRQSRRTTGIGPVRAGDRSGRYNFECG